MPNQIPFDDEEAITVAIELTASFLNCPVVADKNRRETLLSKLRPELRNRMSRSSVAQDDAYNILYTCLRYPDGIDQLIDAVRDSEAGSPEMDAFDDAIDHILPPQPITNREIGSLYKLVKDAVISTSVLRELAIAANTGNATFAAATTRYTRVALLRHLAEGNTVTADTRTYYPLLAFVRSLITRPEMAQQRANLQKWLNNLQARLQPDMVEPPIPSSGVAMSVPDTYYLLIAVSKADEQRFTVSAWLSPQLEQVYSRGPFGIDEMGDMLRDVFDDERVTAARNAVDRDHLIVEVFLPLDHLVSSAVELWTWQDAYNNKRPLGYEHPVVVRSLERAIHGSSQKTWVDHWRRWNSMPAPRRLNPERDLYPLKPEQAQDERALQVDLERSMFLCVMPSPQIKLSLQLLGSILAGGIPFVILTRLDEQCTALDPELKQLIDHGDLEELRRRLWIKRQDAWAGGKPCYVTLIWDEYDRLPKLAGR